jgi:DNA-damage-inducible protein D
MSQLNFEQIKHTENNEEFWFARELMPLLGYKKWETFSSVIEKAKIACLESNLSILDHFPDTRKPIVGGKGAVQNVTDYKLTRYACYLVAMNGDSRKVEIAQAQTYFATQTRRQELLQELENNQKRLENREKLTQNRKNLRQEVHARGVDSGEKFAKLEDNINIGLYTETTAGIKKVKNIPNNKPLDDYTSNIELLSKNLSMEMTKINVIKQNLNGLNPICTEAKDNATAIRETLLDRNIVPEELPIEKNIKIVQKAIKTIKSDPKKLK